MCLLKGWNTTAMAKCKGNLYFQIKTPSKNLISGFRPIALLNVEGKLFFSLISKRLVSHLVQNNKIIKGYLRYKTILCHKVALDVQLMNFFIWRKNNVSFSRYRDFCVFVKSADLKICDVIISIARYESYTYAYFL